MLASVRKSEKEPVQVWNPKVQMYTVIDRNKGEVIGHTKEPLEGVPIVENASKDEGLEGAAYVL